MDNILFSIFTGVISGVLTSALIWIFIKFLSNIFFPWYQNSIYWGIDISVQWTAKLSFKGGRSDQTIELFQKGHKLTGTINSKNIIPNHTDDTTTFVITGEIFDNYIDIEYRSNNKKLIGRGSILLKVKDGGAKLDGSLVAIEKFSTEIMTSTNVVWTRK